MSVTHQDEFTIGRDKIKKVKQGTGVYVSESNVIGYSAITKLHVLCNVAISRTKTLRAFKTQIPKVRRNAVRCL